MSNQRVDDFQIDFFEICIVPTVPADPSLGQNIERETYEDDLQRM